MLRLVLPANHHVYGQLIKVYNIHEWAQTYIILVVYYYYYHITARYAICYPVHPYMLLLRSLYLELYQLIASVCSKCTVMDKQSLVIPDPPDIWTS